MCKERRKPEIVAVWPQFHSPRAWLSSMFMGFQCWDLPGTAEPPSSYLGAALGLLQLLPGARGKCRGARGGMGNISAKDRAFRPGQGGNSGKAGLGKSIHRRAVLSGERGGKANTARSKHRTTITALAFCLVLFLVRIEMRARRRSCPHSSARTVNRASREEQRLLDFCLCCLCNGFAVGGTTVAQVHHPMFVPQVWPPSGEQLSASCFCGSLKRAETPLC